MRYAVIVASALVFPTRALAAQFVVTEVTYEHSATTTTDSHLRLAPSAETPTNWKSPLDYATAGTVYVRLEVFTKPSTENTRFQVCFEATPSYACTNQSPVYTKPGVYTWATPFPSFYQYDKVDWTKGIVKSALILKDDKNVKPAPENVGEARSKLYMPTKLRVTVTAVSPGSTYMEPSSGDAGVDADAAVDASDSETPVDVPVVVDTGTVAVDTGTVVVEDSAPGSDSAVPGAAVTDVEGGCAASPRSTSTASAWPLLGIAAAAIAARRRR